MTYPTAIPGVKEKLNHFIRIPWCRSILEHDGTVALARLDHQETDDCGSTGELFSKTLNGERTISHRVVVYRDPSHPPQPTPRDGSRWLPITSCSVFYNLGPGPCGFSNICHGGVQATLLDDVMGVLMVLNGRLQDGILPSKPAGRWAPKEDETMLDVAGNHVATQSLDFKLLLPLRLPSIVQVEVASREIDLKGRWLTMLGVIKGQDGKEYARAEGTWVTISRTRGKL